MDKVFSMLADTLPETTVLQMLIDLGADLNVEDDMGFTPLHYSLLTDHYDSISLLVKCGADPFSCRQTNEGAIISSSVTPMDVADDDQKRVMVEALTSRR